MLCKQYTIQGRIQLKVIKEDESTNIATKPFHVKQLKKAQSLLHSG